MAAFEVPPTGRRTRAIHGFSFAAGFLVAGAIGLGLAITLLVRLGPEAFLENMLYEPFPRARALVDLPAPVLEELVTLGAVVDNAHNPTGAKHHDTILARPHPTRQRELRPGSRVVGHLLPSTTPLNLDPPVLYLADDAKAGDAVARFVAASSRLAFHYTVGEDGNRITVPEVRAERRVLVVGDSVAFGLGVTDEDTMPSALQRILGDAAVVVNAGVSAFDGHEAFLMARDHLAERPHDVVVYFSAQNDFRAGAAHHFAHPRPVLEEFATLRPEVPGGILVSIVPYMQFTLADVFEQAGWPASKIARTTALMGELAETSTELALTYVDWSTIPRALQADTRTIFSRFALYVDRSHLSPLGNRLAAEALAPIVLERLAALDGPSPAR